MYDTTSILRDTLDSIDWNSRSKSFLSTSTNLECVAKILHRTALWARQIESTDDANPALCFVRMVQIESYHACALISLSLYKPAAAAMRAMLESALYYIYFRTHPSELATLAQDDTYYIEKAEIIAYMERHVPDFKEKQKLFDLKRRIEKWYKTMSGLVHSQIPNSWVSYASLEQVNHNAKHLDDALNHFAEGDKLIHELYLVTLSDLWTGFDMDARRLLLQGLSGTVKGTLGLYIA